MPLEGENNATGMTKVYADRLSGPPNLHTGILLI